MLCLCIQLNDGSAGVGSEALVDGYWGHGEFKPNADSNSEGVGDHSLIGTDGVSGNGNNLDIAMTRNTNTETGTGNKLKYNDPLSFDVIMKELSSVKACVAERATTDMALGNLLETEWYSFRSILIL